MSRERVDLLEAIRASDGTHVDAGRKFKLSGHRMCEIYKPWAFLFENGYIDSGCGRVWLLAKGTVALEKRDRQKKIPDPLDKQNVGDA